MSWIKSTLDCCCSLFPSQKDLKWRLTSCHWLVVLKSPWSVTSAPIRPKKSIQGHTLLLPSPAIRPLWRSRRGILTCGGRWVYAKTAFYTKTGWGFCSAHSAVKAGNSRKVDSILQSFIFKGLGRYGSWINEDREAGLVLWTLLTGLETPMK